MAYREKKRERRRRDLQRMKSKSLKLAKVQMRMMYWKTSEMCNNVRQRMIDRAIRQAEYMAVCSCHDCGNPRKFGSITLQEMKENDKLSTYMY